MLRFVSSHEGCNSCCPLSMKSHFIVGRQTHRQDNQAGACKCMIKWTSKWAWLLQKHADRKVCWWQRLGGCRWDVYCMPSVFRMDNLLQSSCPSLLYYKTSQTCPSQKSFWAAAKPASYRGGCAVSRSWASEGQEGPSRPALLLCCLNWLRTLLTEALKTCSKLSEK